MRVMPKVYRSGATAVILLALAATPAAATDVNQVLGRMGAAMDPGKDMRAKVQLTILNNKGESVEWAGQYYRRSGPDARMRIVFDSPLDLRGTEVAVERGSDGAGRTQVYLPSIRRIRDLTGDTRGESFLGTDFNYEDLGLQQLDYQQHNLRNGDDRGDDYVVESIPDRGWWYGKIVRFIDRRDFLPRRTEYYDRSGVLWKLRTVDVVKKIGPYPTATQITMQTLPTGTSTRITLSDVAYDTGLSDSVFAVP